MSSEPYPVPYSTVVSRWEIVQNALEVADHCRIVQFRQARIV